MTCIWKKGLERGSSYSKVFFAGLTLLLLLFLLLVPTGFEGALQFKDAEKCRVLITDVDNSTFFILEVYYIYEIT
ncbi:MAG: hypothetical protein K6F15_01965 [Treponema sp.]|nr:hypothetical protein [Treponema sp.]